MRIVTFNLKKLETDRLASYNRQLHIAYLSITALTLTLTLTLTLAILTLLT